jgi:hypothetical protein
VGLLKTCKDITLKNGTENLKIIEKEKEDWESLRYYGRTVVVRSVTGLNRSNAGYVLLCLKALKIANLT